jgi:hypothetical protein
MKKSKKLGLESKGAAKIQLGIRALKDKSILTRSMLNYAESKKRTN